MSGKDTQLQPWNGQSGAVFREWSMQLQLELVGRTDKSGSSLWMHLQGTDMGGINGIDFPAGSVGAEMARLGRSRASQAYSAILTNISAPDIKKNLMSTYGPMQAYDMWQYLVSMYDTPMDASRTDDYITQIRRLAIAEHIGFSEDTVQRFADKLIALNSQLTVADRLDDTALGNRILIAIMNASHFLHIEARTELNKTSSLQPGPNWEYEVPALNAAGAPNPNAGQRDLRRLIAHFHEARLDPHARHRQARALCVCARRR